MAVPGRPWMTLTMTQSLVAVVMMCGLAHAQWGNYYGNNYGGYYNGYQHGNNVYYGGGGHNSLRKGCDAGITGVRQGTLNQCGSYSCPGQSQMSRMPWYFGGSHYAHYGTGGATTFSCGSGQLYSNSLQKCVFPSDFKVKTCTK